jgi:hypothetical protein
VVGFFAPSEPSDRPFHERPEAVELERVQAEPVFDQAVDRDAWVVLIVVQSEGTGHLCETNTERQAAARQIYGPAYGGLMVPLWSSAGCTTLHVHGHQRPYYILNSVELI